MHYTSLPYIWVSYYDTTLADTAIFNMRTTTATADHHSKYEWTGQQSYDDLGWAGQAMYQKGKKTATYANKFTANADMSLRAVQFVTANPNASYSVSVYVGPTKASSPTAGGKAAVIKGTKTKSISGKATYAGYQTVALPVPVVLKAGQKYSIVIKTKVKSGNALVPVEQSVGTRPVVSYPVINAGESYLMHGSKWYDVRKLESQISGGIPNMGNTNIIALTSQTPTYTLSYNPNGGTFAGVAAPQTLEFKAAYGALPTVSRDGYALKGWYTAKTKGTKVNSATKMGLANKTIYAQWTAKKYKVTFDANGGSTPKIKTKIVKSMTATTAKAYGTLPTTSRTGYTFLGWFDDQTAGNKVTAKTKFSNAAPQTLYAHWAAKTFTVKFDPRSGTVTTTSMTVTYDSTYGAVTPLPTPNRSGYAFHGWFTKTTGGVKIDDSTTVKITATQTLYAQWGILA